MSGEEIVSDIVEAHEAGTDIADALMRVAEAGKALLATGLSKRALMVLIHDQLKGVPLKHIELVIDALPALSEYVTVMEFPRKPKR